MLSEGTLLKNNQMIVYKITRHDYNLSHCIKHVITYLSQPNKTNPHENTYFTAPEIHTQKIIFLHFMIASVLPHVSLIREQPLLRMSIWACQLVCSQAHMFPQDAACQSLKTLDALPHSSLSVNRFTATFTRLGSL